MNEENYNESKFIYPLEQNDHIENFNMPYTGADSSWEHDKKAEEASRNGVTDNFMGEIIGRHTDVGYTHIIDSVRDRGME